MDISGRLTLHLPLQTGEGKNGPWQKSGFVIETSNDRYPKKVCFTTWGDTIAMAQAFKEGDEVKVFFDVESREYQGKWYSDIKAWKVDRLAAGPTKDESPSNQTTAPDYKAAPPSNSNPADDSFNNSQDDDLPF